MITLATDIDGIELAAALTGTNGQIRDRRELPAPASQTPQALRDALFALISPLQVHVQRVTIVSTGIIRDGSLLALNSYNLSGLLHSPLAKALERLTNLPITAISDAQATTWTEYQVLDDDITDMIFIIISTNVGGGAVNGSRLRTGPNGLAGHIGHTPADPYGPACGCEYTGCVEAIASGCDIATAAQGELVGTNARTIFTHIRRGDEQAQQLIHRSARAFARLTTDTKTTTGYQCVAVGDSVGLAEGYLALVKTYLAQEPAAFHIDLLAAHYHHNVGLLGAALLARGEML